MAVSNRFSVSKEGCVLHSLPLKIAFKIASKPAARNEMESGFKGRIDSSNARGFLRKVKLKSAARNEMESGFKGRIR